MHTTVERVKLYAKQFSELSDELVQMAIDDTYPIVINDKLGEDYQELGNRLLTCHFLLVNNIASTNGVQSATMLGESQTMFDWSKSNDPYIELYRNLVDDFGGTTKGKGLVMTFG